MKRHISKAEDSVIQDHLTLGKITGVFGLKGEVRVFLHNPRTDLFDKKRPIVLYISPESIVEKKMSCRSGAGKRIIGKLEGVSSVEQARSFIGATICIHPKHLPHPEENEFYHYQLLGMLVSTPSGIILGNVTEIVPSGLIEDGDNSKDQALEDNQIDILIVEDETMKYYIPFTKEEVLEVSLQHGILVPDIIDESEILDSDDATRHTNISDTTDE